MREREFEETPDDVYTYTCVRTGDPGAIVRERFDVSSL